MGSPMTIFDPGAANKDDAHSRLPQNNTNVASERTGHVRREEDARKHNNNQASRAARPEPGRDAHGSGCFWLMVLLSLARRLAPSECALTQVQNQAGERELLIAELE